MTEDAYLQSFSPTITEDDYIQEFDTPARADKDFFCSLRLRTVLLLDSVCFCRNRNIHCRQCVFDRDEHGRLQAQLILMLTDLLEDRSAEVRRLSLKK
jgi:hypothetical protein